MKGNLIDHLAQFLDLCSLYFQIYELRKLVSLMLLQTGHLGIFAITWTIVRGNPVDHLVQLSDL